MVAGCASTGLEGVGAPASYAPSVQAGQIVGRWGLASYYNEVDRPRIETAARDQCKQPYLINKGRSGGVIMHLADKREPEELRMKGAAGGKTFIGPEGDAGGELDREIISFNDNVLVLRWVDPEVAGRYGTMVYARCDVISRPAPKR
jgi:hypothetical protein